MGRYNTELRFGVTFEEPTDQGWTFGTYDVLDAAQRTLLIEHGMDPTEVSKLEEYDEISETFASALNLEFPRYNNACPLGRHVLSIRSSSKTLEEGTGHRLGYGDFEVRLEDLLRLESAIKTLGLTASSPSWLLMSVYD